MSTNKELLEKAIEILYSTDGYAASDLNKIFEAIKLLQQMRLSDENPTIAEPTAEELEILTQFDEELFELLDDYREPGEIRAEVLHDAVISNVQIWLGYALEYGEESDDNS